MYAKSRKYRQAWREIVGGAEAIIEEATPFANFWKSGPTLLVLTPHPVSWGPTNEDWTELGTRLRHLLRMAKYHSERINGGSKHG